MLEVSKIILKFRNTEQKPFFKICHISSFSCGKRNKIFSEFVHFWRFWFTFRFRSPIFTYTRCSLNGPKSSHLQSDVFQWTFRIQMILTCTLIRMLKVHNPSCLLGMQVYCLYIFWRLKFTKLSIVKWTDRKVSFRSVFESENEGWNPKIAVF